MKVDLTQKELLLLIYVLRSVILLKGVLTKLLRTLDELDLGEEVYRLDLVSKETRKVQDKLIKRLEKP